jgi:hypothetical protein
MTGGGRTRLEIAHRLLADAVHRLATSEGWRAMLAAAARYPRYSVRNCLLLAAQGAHGRVAGYRTWQRIPAADGGTCQVRAGAKGVVVLAPRRRPVEHLDAATGAATVDWVITGFRAVTVFDETTLVRPPAPPITPRVLDGDLTVDARPALIEVIEAHGFVVAHCDTSPALGMTLWEPRMVFLHHRLPDAQQLKTLAHEAGHVLLHDPDGPAATMPRAVQEVEAESVAHLTAGHLGLDASGYSVPYLAGWAPEPALILQRADRVLETAHHLTAAVDRRLGIAPDPQPLEPFSRVKDSHVSRISTPGLGVR